MRNKTWKYLVVTSAIFVLSACGGGTKKQVNEDVSMDSGVRWPEDIATG